MTFDDCQLIDLPKFEDVRGNLTFIEPYNHIPFEIARIYYLYEVPKDMQRGGHGHKKLQQVIIAISGSFDIVIDDGNSKKKFHLNSSCVGLYIPKMLWRNLESFSSKAICLILASRVYEAEDYYHDYKEFLSAKGVKI